MSQRAATLASVTAATLIVGGSLYALLRHAAPMLEIASPPSAPSARVAVPMPSVRVSPSTSAPTATGAIYRCEAGGSTVYSDAPCKGGRVVEVQNTQGWEAPRPSARWQSVQIAETSTKAPAVASSSEKSRASECALLEQQIAQIDAAARAGGTISYMEDLKERRRKLVERRNELRC